MGSVRQIAKRLGISPATVSRALNNHPYVDAETRRKVLQGANKVGYAPGGRRVGTVVGLVYPGEVVLADYGAFESALLAGILRGLNEHRFDVKILSLQRDKSADESYSEFFRRKGIRGAVLRSFKDTRRICQDIADEGFPSVVVADRFEEPAVNYVCCNSRDDSRRAVQHLIDLGHRRIALGIHQIADTDHIDRRQGYEEAMAQAGIAIDRSLVVEIVASPTGGASLITRLMSMPKPPTAVFFTDPLATIGALRRCLEMGVSIPTDLSVVGFDDSDIRQHTFPAFSAVVQDAQMIGLEAALWLTRRIVQPNSEELKSIRLVRPTFLEINQSTGRPTARPFRILPDGTRTELTEVT